MTDTGFPDPDTEDTTVVDDETLEILVEIWSQEEDTEIAP